MFTQSTTPKDTPAIEWLCAAGAQVAAMQTAAEKNPALAQLAIVLAEELLAIHTSEVAPEYAEAVAAQRAARAKVLGDVQARQAQRAADRMKAEGPALWAEWHRRALARAGDDSGYLRSLAQRLPCGQCRADFVAILAAHPPRWDDYFAWTVEVHNDVNTRLGKPAVTVEAARILWSKPAA
jgi:muconolactone delta-isomerase